VPISAAVHAVNNNGQEITLDPVTRHRGAIVEIDPGLTPTYPGRRPTGIACRPLRRCVDVIGHEVTFDPRTGRSRSVLIDADHYLWGVACPSAHLCVAVGTGSADHAVTFEPTSRRHPRPRDIGRHSISVVACTSLHRCVAVKNDSRAIDLDPTTGAHTSQAISGAAALDAITCVSAAECVAVDRVGEAFTAAADHPTGVRPLPKLALHPTGVRPLPNLALSKSQSGRLKGSDPCRDPCRGVACDSGLLSSLNSDAHARRL
jgi:hypothetical protein